MQNIWLDNVIYLVLTLYRIKNIAWKAVVIDSLFIYLFCCLKWTSSRSVKFCVSLVFPQLQLRVCRIVMSVYKQTIMYRNDNKGKYTITEDLLLCSLMSVMIMPNVRHFSFSLFFFNSCCDFIDDFMAGSRCALESSICNLMYCCMYFVSNAYFCNIATQFYFLFLIFLIEEVLLRVKEQRIILHKISKRNVYCIGHILCRNCLLQRVIEGKIKGG